MALLLALGLSVLAVAVLPGTARPALLIGGSATETAVVVGTLTGDPVLTFVGAVAAAIVALLLCELFGSAAYRLAPGRERARGRALERRATERSLAAHERLRRHEQRRIRRARDDERIAA
ncbi:MAG: hypothetical protein U0R69_08270 [Gaiellales bacterium]